MMSGGARSSHSRQAASRLQWMSGTRFIMNAHVGRTMADDWHALRAEAVLQRLDSSPLGLTSREASQRLSRFGPNELVQTARVSPLRILLSQFVDVLVIVLIIAAVISATLGLLQGETADLYDAVLIIVIVIMNAILGFVQEYRAERSLEALKSLAAPKAHVLREGGVVAVPSRELVPGEVVVLAAGDRVPADARLLEVASLRVNEASLTGESLPVSKSVEPQPRDSYLGDRKNMVFMGTTVDGGRGRAVLVETGMSTQLGKIAGLVQEETKEATPRQKPLDRLGRQIRIAVLLASGLVGYGAVRDGSDRPGLGRMDGRVVRHEGARGMQRQPECGALCNDGVLKTEGPRGVVEGDPTEGALLGAARRAGMDPEAVR